MGKKAASAHTLFEEESQRGNHPMPAPHFVQPDTGVASDIGLRLTTETPLSSLRVKSENLEQVTRSGITHGGQD